MLGNSYNLGNAQINGGGTYSFTLKTIPEQCQVRWLNIQVTATVIASESSYSFQNSAPILVAEGKDDVDTILSAIFTSIDLAVSPSYNFLSSMSIPRLRTGLAYMNGQDFQAPANGTAVVNSAGTALSFNLKIPMGLEGIIPDFSCFDQGSQRFASAGQINFNYAALTSGNFTGTFADGSHTFTIAQSSVSVLVSARLKTVAFGPGFVGPGWQLTYGSGAVTTGQTKPGIHLALFDQTGQPENVGSGYVPTGYNAQNGATAIAQNTTPAQLIANFRADRTQGTFVDATARGYPIQYYPLNDTLNEIDQSGQPITYQVTETGSTTLSLLELVAIPPSAADISDIASRIGNGGQVAVDRPVVKSMQGRRPTNLADTPLLPIIIYPAGAAPSGLAVMQPAAVGNYLAQAIGTAVSTAKAAAPYGKTGKQLVGGGR